MSTRQSFFNHVPRGPLYALLFLILYVISPATLFAAEEVAAQTIRIGVTPVFMDYKAAFIDDFRRYLEQHMGHPVAFVRRGNYREIVNLLLDEKIDFAWLCGYPYVRYKNVLQLVAVPVYKGEPLYQSYLIIPSSDDRSLSLSDLRGKFFAFSDPDSATGYLFFTYVLAKQGESSSSFFRRSFFTWSHRKVIEAVAFGLAQGGAVDGYIWETQALAHPELTSKTRVLYKSPKFGYPPFVASKAASKDHITELQHVLFQMDEDEEGSRLLATLNLDGFVRGSEHLYDSIEEMAQFVERQKQ